MEAVRGWVWIFSGIAQCSTYASYCDSHPCGQISLDNNECKRGYQTTVFVAGTAHDFQVFSHLSLLVILPHYLSDQKALLKTTSVVSILTWLKHS